MPKKRVKLTLVDGGVPADPPTSVSLKGPCPPDFPEDLFKMLGDLCDAVNSSIESGEMTAEEWEQFFDAMNGEGIDGA
jgi:hypothetical protein